MHRYKLFLKILSVLTSIFFYSSALRADNAGITLAGTPSNAKFKGFIDSNNQPTTATIFDIDNKIDVSFEITVAPEHIGQQGFVYIVANYADKWYMKSANGWQPWNLNFDTLIPYTGSHLLNAKETVIVEKQLSGLEGSFNVYVSYKTNNLAQYNLNPLSFNVSHINEFNCASTPTSPITINVKDQGAIGNGAVDDTAAIQAAIDKVAATGGTVLVPDGIYLIDALKSINLKSNITFRMMEHTTLQAIPNNNSHYNIISIENASNINILGGTIKGERNAHQASDGEWGMGLGIYNSKNIVVEKVTAQDNWGDGFYIGKYNDLNSENITFCSVIADNNRRQGMSVVAVNQMTVSDSLFTNTNGIEPSAGIDLEPNLGNTVSNVKISHSEFINNAGPGIKLVVPDVFGDGATLTNITVDSNTVINNGRGAPANGGIEISNARNNTIINNIVKNNVQYGIHLRVRANNNVITGNHIITDANDITGIVSLGNLTNKIENNSINGN